MEELRKRAAAAVGSERLVDTTLAALAENGVPKEVQEHFLVQLSRQVNAPQKQGHPVWVDDDLGVLRRDIDLRKRELVIIEKERKMHAMKAALAEEEYRVRAKLVETLERELAELEHALAPEKEPSGPAGAPPSGD